MPDINMQVFEEAQRNQLVTEIDIQTQVALDDYQVQLSNITNPTQSQDNVVIDRYGEFLPHWNESLDFDTWVKISMGVAGKRLLMLRGNSSVSSNSNGDNVFIQYKSPSSSNYLESAIIAVPYVWEGNIWRGSSTSQVKFGVSNVADPYDAAADSTFLFYDDAGNWLYGYTNNDGSRTNNNAATSWIDNQRYKVKIVAAPSLITYSRETGSLSFTINSNIPDESGGLVQSIAQGSGGHDWAFIRNYTAVEPIVTVYTEQNIAVALKSLGRAG